MSWYLGSTSGPPHGGTRTCEACRGLRGMCSRGGAITATSSLATRVRALALPGVRARRRSPQPRRRKQGPTSVPKRSAPVTIRLRLYGAVCVHSVDQYCPSSFSITCSIIACRLPFWYARRLPVERHTPGGAVASATWASGARAGRSTVAAPATTPRRLRGWSGGTGWWSRPASRRRVQRGRRKKGESDADGHGPVVR